jgi:hypothetical protein
MDTNPGVEKSPGLTGGRLEGISVPDLLWALCRRKVTGVLRISRGESRKSVYFEEGRIVFASSGDPDDRLGELLLREGLVSLERLESAVESLGDGKRLGTVLVEAGDLSAGNLVKGVLLQVKLIVLDLFGWEAGTYGFEEGPLPTDEVITLGMSTGELLLEGVRRSRSFVWLRGKVGPPRTRYRLAEGWEGTLEGLALSEGERMVRTRLEQGPETVAGLCDELYLSNFEIYQALCGFRILGAIREEEALISNTSEATLEGPFGAEGIAGLLVQLCRAGETGVLYVTRDSLERTLHLKEGQCVFATSSDIDDGLVAYLLRRGVISLRDREETAKRLLSNKRVGTILRELGVIDGQDLREMVQDHLREIIFDTLRWNGGEYAFVPGELPTIEEITLDDTVETLVAHGLRRVNLWSLVRSGFGGIDRPLTLTPDFLNVLDRMDIGPEEWAVATALRDPSTALEVCHATELGDFRVCQILWIFHRLGVVSTLAEEERPAAQAAKPIEEPVMAGPTAPEPVEEPVEVEATEPEPEPQPVEEPVEIEAMEPEPEPQPVEEPVEVEATEPEPEPQPVEEPVEIEATGFTIAPEESTDEQAPTEEPMPVKDEAPDVAGIPFEAMEPEHAEAECAEGVLDRDDPVPDEAPDVDGIPYHDAAVNLPHETTDAESLVDEEPEQEDAEPVSEEIPVTTMAFDEEVDQVPEDPADEETPPLDSPTDATRYIPRDEVAAALEADEVPVEEPGAVDDVEIDEFGSDTQVLSRAQVDRVLDGPPPEDPVPEEHSLPDADTSPATYNEVDTARISADEIGSGGDAEEIVVEDGDPPIDLDEAISRFSARQRILYRTIRAEIGAAAPNFVRSCCGKVESGSPFPDDSLRGDGSWDADGLRQAAIDHRIPDPWKEYERLLELELDMLRLHLGEAQAAALQDQLRELEGADGR